MILTCINIGISCYLYVYDSFVKYIYLIIAHNCGICIKHLYIKFIN